MYKKLRHVLNPFTVPTSSTSSFHINMSVKFLLRTIINAIKCGAGAMQHDMTLIKTQGLNFNEERLMKRGRPLLTALLEQNGISLHHVLS